ncbi:hypothetical protein [Sphingobacterium sp. JUb56]|uniref:hypothetical protein n=1 Tax=Sphingobacterium sp. JUb56 TaxID=2587145 RepID=UPI00161421EB|nr:hypothetical protein [Sphingobacterium sp. JUb56]MBB2950118.1 outer membrane protein assembly factor BamB [Sphingobacterium sp. JUb56]
MNIVYKQFIIKIIDEPDYENDSSDNIFRYSKIYSGNDFTYRITSKHGIKVYHEGQVIYSCIITGTAGATSVNQNSYIIDEDQLVICCSDTIFCLSLPDLNLMWKMQTDPITCFQIFKHNDDYLVHGETQVTKLNKNGKIIWKFEGADIFVSLDDESFRIENDSILLMDFSNRKYKIDFDGKIIEGTK